MRKTYSDYGRSATERMPTAINDDTREQQLVYLATELAEKQLREGTASSQVITHFLKLGTRKAELEAENLRLQSELLKAKTEAIERDKNMGEAYERAIMAMRRYSGADTDEPEPFEEYGGY